MNDDAPSLSGIGLLNGLAESDRDLLAQSCRWHRYSANHFVFSHEDETSDVYFIVTGQVRVTVYSASGKEVSFADLSAGASFGELSAIDGLPRSATVVALSDTVLASLPAKAFLQLLYDHPDVAANMMQYLVGLIRRLSDRVVEFNVLAVRNRIHAELLRLSHDHGTGGNTAMIAPAPTHAEIASRVSTHREAVTRELSALARKGLVERRHGALVIADIARLAQLVETGFQD